MKLRHRTLALILSAIMTITYMPSLAFAAEEDPAVDANDVVAEESDTAADDESPAAEEEQIELQAEGDGDNIASGKWGTCDWVIDAGGCLTISAGDTGQSTSTWDNYRSKITSVKTGGIVKVNNCQSMFMYCSKMVSADLSKMDTSGAESMAGMFEGCEALTSLDLRNFDTSNVTNMSAMFCGCESLTKLDISSFDTSNVTDMSRMFDYDDYYDDVLTSLDLSSFDTSKVTNMEGMFKDRNALTTLNLGSNFNTGNVTDMSELFYGCSTLKTLDVSHFDTRNVSDMSEMFGGCESLTALDLSSFDTSNIISLDYMFSECESLTTLDVSGFDTKNVTDMRGLFCNCKSLTSIDLSNFDTSSVTSMASMFDGCLGLSSLDLSNFNTSNVTDMSRMFSGGSGDMMKSLNLSSFDTSKVESMDYMFNGKRSLETLILGSSFDTSGITNMDFMFSECKALKKLDLSSFDTSNVTSMRGMFENCEALTSVNLSSFDTSKVTDMVEMFHDCMTLETLDVSSFDTSSVIYMGEHIGVMEDEGMFSGCRSLKSLDLSNFNTSNVKNMGTMFSECYALESVDVSSFDTSSATDLSGMFNGCWGLKNVDVSGFDTSSATNIKRMFMDCRSLESINVSSFDTRNVETMLGLFYGCKSLKTLDLSSFDTSAATDLGEIIYDCTSLKTLKTGTWIYSDYVKNHEYYPTFPVNMKDSATGKIYNAGTYIPEKSNATYSFTDESVVEFRYAPSKAATAESLYGEHREYLDNQVYKQVSIRLYDLLFAGMANRSEFADWMAEAKNAMREGIVGSVQYIVKDRVGYSRYEMQKELALELVVAMGSDEDLSKKLDYSEMKTASKAIKSVSGIIKDNEAPSETEMQKIAEAFAPKSKKKQAQIVKNLEYLKNNKNGSEAFEKIQKKFKALGYTFTFTDAVMAAYTTSLAQAEIIDELIPLVDKNSDLGKGLASLKKEQERGFTVNVLLNFLQDFGDSEITSQMEDFLMDKSTSLTEKLINRWTGATAGSLSATFAISEFLYWGLSYAVPGKTADEVVESWKSIAIVNDLHGACCNYRKEIDRNWKNGGPKTLADLQHEHELLMTAYYWAMMNCADHVKDCAPDFEKSVIENGFKQIGGKLKYSSYLDSCLANANASFNVTGTSAGVTISKLNNSTKYLLAESNSSETPDELIYIDIPEKVKGYKIIGLEDETCLNRTDISAVFIPDSVETIGNNTFNGCGSLDTVYMGGVKTIGSKAFGSCVGLISIDLPESIEKVENDAFDGVENLVVTGASGSAANTFADSNNITFEARDKTVKSIQVVSEPEKKEYRMDEPLDLAGLSVKAEYADGSEATISEGINAWIADRKVGTNSVTVEYGGCTDTFNVTVTSAECTIDIYCTDVYGHELADKTSITAAGGDTITVNAPAVEGYAPERETQELTVSYFNEVTFRYTPAVITNIEEAELEYEEEAEYTGKQITPEIKVILNGNTLEIDKEYTVSYGDNIEGSGFIYIEGIGDYDGAQCVIFDIKSVDPCEAGHTFGDWKVTKAATEIAAGEKTRTCSVCGYSEKQTIAQLAPTLPAVKIAKPKAAKKSATVKWKKVSKKNLKKIKKIEIQYSLDKNFKTGVVTKYAKAKKTSLKIKKLKSKKTYYIRLRAYTSSGGKVHVSKWSARKKVKTK